MRGRRDAEQAPRGSVTLVTAVLFLAGCALAPAAAQPVGALHHTGWFAGRDLPIGGVSRIARTPDGYLWLGTIDGLVRFDGVRFVTVNARSRPELASATAGTTDPLALDRTGALWIGRSDGALVRYRDGRFAVIHAPAGEGPRIDQIVEDGSGRLWLLGGGRLFVWRGGRPAPAALPPEVPATGITGIAADSGGGIWLGTGDRGLWRIGGSGARQEPHPHPPRDPRVRPLLVTRDGTLFVAGDGMQVLRDGRWSEVRIGGRAIQPGSAIDSPDGSVWIATAGDGLLHWHDGALTRYSVEAGLTSALAEDLLLDREGTLWATTDAGLDRFRASPFRTIGRDQLPFAVPLHTEGDANGGVWAMSYETRRTHLLVNGAIVNESGPPSVTTIPGTDVLLTRSRGGGVWLFGLHDDRVYRIRDGLTRTVAASPGLAWRGPRVGFEDASGTLWLGSGGGGFGRVADFAYTPVDLPRSGPWPRVASITGDDRGDIWVSVRDTALYRIGPLTAVQRFDREAGLTEVLFNLTLQSGDTLWATTQSGSLVRLIGGRPAYLRIPDVVAALSAGSVVLVPTPTHLWLGTQGGIGRVRLDALHAAADGGERIPLPQWFGEADGLEVARTSRTNVRAGFVARDGRIWFATPVGLAVVDPENIPSNPVAPTPIIEDVRVTGRSGPAESSTRIAPDPERVEIHYTATSLRMPERVRIEYRLDGADRAWVTGGVPRVATYTQLRPGRYRFRVRAWNEDGVPSLREASLALHVLPSWHQTAWFSAALAAAVAGMGAGVVVLLQRARQRRIEDRIRASFEATLAERTRIASELHDTLLQGFTGITLQLQAVQKTVANAAPATAEALARLLGLADSTLRGARQMVWDMRAPELEEHDLPDALERAARDAIGNQDIRIGFQVRGSRRRLAPAVETAAFRVGREAVLNAVRHASPAVIHVELELGDAELRVTVRDDGCGIAPAAIAAGANGGRLGVLGMRERAVRAGGSLDIRGSPGAGTTVSLVLPLPRSPHPQDVSTRGTSAAPG